MDVKFYRSVKILKNWLRNYLNLNTACKTSLNKRIFATQKREHMKFILSIIAIVFGVTMLYGQTETKHVVYFERGQASISLTQLDSIKAMVQEARQSPNARIVVHTYANDALEGASNQRLSGKRAYLLQQCLEREGVPLAHMQIENKIRSIGETEACGNCGKILITTDSNFFFQNVYHDQVADFLMDGSAVNAQTFWIRPFEEVLLTTKDGVIVQIPANALATKDSGLVKFDVRFLEQKWDMLLHSLATRSADQQFLDLNRAVHLSVTQYGAPLEMNDNKHITVILPSDLYSKNAALYQQEGTNWVAHPNDDDLKVGSFYSGENYHCNGSGDALDLPTYKQPPVKPTYLIYDSVTAHQDELLKGIQIRLDYLEEQKVNKKGKPQALSPKQKQNEYLLKTKKDRLLIAKEKLKIEARDKNKSMEQAYYKALAAYNKERNQQQRRYIKGLDSLGAEQRAQAARCKEHQESITALRTSYGQDKYEKIAAVLRNLHSNNPLGYWMKTNQLGWLSVGNKAERKVDNVVPYRVTSTISAYKITAFLIFDDTQDIVVGETLDDTDIIFWEVPDGRSAKLLAVTQEGDNFLVAFHAITTSGNPVQLEFKQERLKDLLERL